jgi:adenosylcobinamide-GDP ribazoletransferase
MRRIMDNPALWRDTIRALRFFSRLPLPTLPGEQDAHAPPDLSRLMPVVPLAGLVLGGLAGIVLIAAASLWGSMIAAILCVAAAVAMTGAFHEDGLADTTDSMGGSTVEKRLEIMKDSRIGTFGASALVLSLGLRVAAIAGLLAAAGAGRTALALAATGAISRTAALILAAHLPPARTGGAGHAAGIPTVDGWGRGCLIAAALALLAWPASGLGGVVAVIAVAAGVATLAERFARHHVGGHTGDLAGATQQVTEIAVLLTLLIFA